MTPQVDNLCHITPIDLDQCQQSGYPSYINLPQVLVRNRLHVGYKGTATRSDNRGYGDGLAFTHVGVILQEPSLMMYRELIDGQVDWLSDTITSSNTYKPRSFDPPQLAQFSHRQTEIVKAYIMRSSPLQRHVDTAVKRAEGSDDLWATLLVRLWIRGLKPGLRLEQLSGMPPKTL